ANVYLFAANQPLNYADSDGREIIVLPGPIRPGPIVGDPIPVPLLPGTPDEGDFYNPTVEWERAGSEIDKIRKGSDVEARSACLDLTRLAPAKENQYFYAFSSFGRALGGAAVLWHKQPGQAAIYTPPGYRAARGPLPGQVP